MGVVYRAHDPRLGRDVAIKFLLAWERGDAGAAEPHWRDCAGIARELADPTLELEEAVAYALSEDSRIK